MQVNFGMTSTTYQNRKLPDFSSHIKKSLKMFLNKNGGKIFHELRRNRSTPEENAQRREELYQKTKEHKRTHTFSLHYPIPSASTTPEQLRTKSLLAGKRRTRKVINFCRSSRCCLQNCFSSLQWTVTCKSSLHG